MFRVLRPVGWFPARNEVDLCPVSPNLDHNVSLKSPTKLLRGPYRSFENQLENLCNLLLQASLLESN